jgi:hypothetical protein
MGTVDMLWECLVFIVVPVERADKIGLAVNGASRKSGDGQQKV